MADLNELNILLRAGRDLATYLGINDKAVGFQNVVCVFRASAAFTSLKS